MGPLGASLPFVHPALAAVAVGAALIPVVIHILNRRRYTPVPWAAMTFLMAARRRSASRTRLEHWSLLLLRMILILALGAAIARPYVPASGWVARGAHRGHHVLLLDNSLSMNVRRPDGTTRWDLAKQYADRLVSSLKGNDAVSVVTLAAPSAVVIGPPSFDRKAVRDRLAALESTEQGTDVPGAVEHALSILGRHDSAPGNQFVYILSDFQKNLWPFDAAPTAAGLAAVKLVDALEATRGRVTLVVVPPEEAENSAIVNFQLDSRLIGVRTPVRVRIEAAHYGRETVRGAVVELRREGRIIRREVVGPLTAQTSAWVTFTVEFESEGTHPLEARILTTADDALPNDNARFLSVQVHKSRPALLIDGNPVATPLGGQAAYVATALAPRLRTTSARFDSSNRRGPAQDSLIQPKVISVSALDAEVLSHYALIALCNVARLSDGQWSLLARFAAEGGGLLIFAGDAVDPAHYNEKGNAKGEGLLPFTLGSIARVQADASDSPGIESGLSIRPESLTHEIVAEFAGAPNSSLFTARAQRYWTVEPDARRCDVVLRYGNGHAALLAGRHGLGRIVLFPTSASMDWTNLPAKGDFVSLLLNVLNHVCPPRDEHRHALAGEALLEPISAAESSFHLEATGTDGTSYPVRVVPLGDGLAARSGPFPRAGFYDLKLGSAVRILAVNTEAAESDPRSADQRNLESLLRGRATVISAGSEVSGPPAELRTAELAQFILLAVAALLLVELGFAMAIHRPVTASHRPPLSKRGAS